MLKDVAPSCVKGRRLRGGQGLVYDFHKLISWWRVCRNHKMMTCLSKSQVGDIMMMCLSKSQDDDIMMCLSKSQDDDIMMTCLSKSQMVISWWCVCLNHKISTFVPSCVKGSPRNPRIPSRFINFTFKRRFVPACASLNRGFRGLVKGRRTKPCERA